MKKKISKILALVLVAVVLVGLCACGSTPDDGKTPTPDGSGGKVEKDKEVTLTMAAFLQAGNQHEVPLTWIANQMYERSGGTIKAEYYSGGTLLDAAGTLDGVKQGVADIGIIQLGDYPGRFPELGMSEIPGMYFASPVAYGNAVKEYIETYAPAEIEGVKILAIESSTTGVIGTNRGPIRSPKDLEGQTLRSLGNAAKCCSAFGAVPADVSIADCYESLRTGVIDGIITLLGALDGFKLSEVLNYAMSYPLSNSTAIWIMNEDSYNRLSDNQKAALDSAWAEGSDMLMRLPDDIYSCTSIVKAIEQIGDYHYPTESEIESFRVLLQPIVQTYAADLTAKGMDGEGILKNWQTIAEKWNEEYPNKAMDADDYYYMAFPDTGERVDVDNAHWDPAY